MMYDLRFTICKNVYRRTTFFVFSLFFGLTLLSSSPLLAQDARDQSRQFPSAQKFIRLLPLQNFDTIAPLLSPELKQDSTTKADLLAAGDFVKSGKSSMHWIYERLSADSIECRYIDRSDKNRTHLLIRLKFGVGVMAGTIIAIQIFNVDAMQKAGIYSGPIEGPPEASEEEDPVPPPPPPPPPKPRH